MRIGIDLHTIDHIMQGSRTYIVALTQALLSIDHTNDYILYMPHDGSGHELFPQPNVTFRPVPTGNRIVRLAITFPAQLLRDRIDVFHCQYIGPLVAPCKVVSTIHDILHEAYPEFFPKNLGRMMRLSYPYGARHASAILTGSDFTKSEIVARYHIPTQRIHVTPYAVSPEFSPNTTTDATRLPGLLKQYGITRPFILSLGRIEPRKNLPALLQAFQQVVTQGTTSHTLVIAGSVDPLFRQFHDDLISRFAAAKLPVQFTGPIAQEDIAALYRAADLFVYPSFAEGFGLPVLEAMACGTPVIASNTTSIPEVTGSDGAELVDPHNPQALADIIAALLKDPARRLELGRRALARAQTFSWTRCAEQTLSVYRQLLAHP